MKQTENSNYETLGFDKRAWDTLRENIEHDIKNRYRGPGNYLRENAQINDRIRDSRITIQFLIGRHFGHNVHSADEIRKLLTSGIETSLDYFYGEYLADPRWAEEMSKLPDNEYLQWMQVYRNGIFFCLLADDDQSLTSLVNWVDPSLPFDETSYLLTPQDNMYHKLLAEFLSGKSIFNGKFISEIVDSRKRRPKLLLTCLEAIQARDELEVSHQLQSYLNHFLKTDFDDGGFKTHISLEGSILWHVAKRNRINVSGLSDKQMAMIITRISLGLE